MATTNYDGLIEQASGWQRVTWLNGAAMQRALQGDDPSWHQACVARLAAMPAADDGRNEDRR